MHIRPAHDDPHHSVDLFDIDRRNEWGGLYCVAPAILYSQVKEEWSRYQRDVAAEMINDMAKIAAQAETMLW